MKALLICPGRRAAVTFISESCPLIVAPLLGKCLVEYWIEYLVAHGVNEIVIASADRPSRVKITVGDGARWGLSIEITDESRELSNAQALDKYCKPPNTQPAFVVRMDHLPGRPGIHLFESYATWFAGLQSWIPRAQTLERIGQCEVLPGVWVGLRARIDPAARLVAPCWLGDHVSVNGDAVIGPGAILEDGVVVDTGACVAQSVIGPATFVGARTKVENSIAHRQTLINWTTNSCLRVPDAFWLSSLLHPLSELRSEVWRRPVQIETDGANLSITELDELSTSNSKRFSEQVQAALTPLLSGIAIDLSATRFIDSCGLATLCGLHRRLRALGISLTLLNPSPALLQLIELTQTQHLLRIDRTEPSWPGMPKPAITRFKPAQDSISKSILK